MARLHALDLFRRRAIERAMENPLPALFVLDPRMHASAAVVSSWDPVSTLQVMGGARRPEQSVVRDTLLHAIELLGARSVVICGEGERPPQLGPDTDELFASWRALLEDSVLGPLVSRRAITVEVLWFDTQEGDVYRWSTQDKRFELLSDLGVMRLLAELKERGGMRHRAA